MKSKLSLIALIAAAASVAYVGAVPEAASADAGSCFPLAGLFDAVPVAPPECTSPVGFCTAGSLTGSLNGTYQFTMDSVSPADPRVPGINNFAGVSVVSTNRGATLSGVDTGTIDLNPARFGNFVSLITFQSGTDYLAGATGQIALRGQLDFASGMTEGNFRGRLCF